MGIAQPQAVGPEPYLRGRLFARDVGNAVLAARQRGASLDQERRFTDAWIAAAALQLSVPLATHNASDFEAVEGLLILTAKMKS